MSNRTRTRGAQPSEVTPDIVDNPEPNQPPVASSSSSSSTSTAEQFMAQVAASLAEFQHSVTTQLNTMNLRINDVHAVIDKGKEPEEEAHGTRYPYAPPTPAAARRLVYTPLPPRPPTTSHSTTSRPEGGEESTPALKERRGSVPIQKFTGANVKAGDATMWLRILEIQFVDRNITLDHRKLETALCALESEALYWATNCRIEGEFVDYETFMDLFIARYEVKNIAEKSMIKLSKLKYRNDPERLYNEFICLVDRIPKMRNEKAWTKQTYMSYLPETLQNYIFDHYPTVTLEELPVLLQRYERTLEHERLMIAQLPRSHKSSYNKPSGSSTSFHLSPDGSDKLKSNINRRTDTSRSSSTPTKTYESVPNDIFQERIRKGLCGRCAQPGHNARQCRNPRKMEAMANVANATTPSSN
jgi:hypothetical protein